VLDRQGISIISVAANSAEAIACADLQPDAVLTDVHLGEASGLLLASRIAGLDQAGSPRVILISASPKDDVGKALRTGSTVEFVSETDLLATAIRTALGLTPDDQTAGGEQMRAMSRPHVRPATDHMGFLPLGRHQAGRLTAPPAVPGQRPWCQCPAKAGVRHCCHRPSAAGAGGCTGIPGSR
jgi:CheY-like chemotaxis protein